MLEDARSGECAEWSLPISAARPGAMTRAWGIGARLFDRVVFLNTVQTGAAQPRAALSALIVQR